jgi:hypothetical protein
MSSYSRPNTIGNIYNPNGYVGLEESGTKLILDLSNYFGKDSAVFSGDILQMEALF